MSRHLPLPSPVEDGGRFELRLESEPKTDEVVYSARFFSPEALQLGTLRLVPGARRASYEGEAPPSWLLDAAVALLKAHARSGAAWPRRWTRWRKAPSSAEASEPGEDELGSP